jgi:hypothetical protein
MPRIAVVLNPQAAPKRSLLARLLFGGPKRAYRPKQNPAAWLIFSRPVRFC